MMRSAWLDPVREPTRRLSPQVLAPLAVLLVAFLALNVAIAVLIVSGRLDGHWYDFRDLGNAVQALREWLDDRTADQPGWLSDLLGDHWLSYIVTALIGAIGMELVPAHEQGRLSYWLGRAYWNRGYGTEAVTALVEHSFVSLKLHRIYAPHFHTNPASGRVLQKVGMTHEGRLREHYLRFGQRIDVELYGMLRQEFIARRPANGGGTSPRES